MPDDRRTPTPSDADREAADELERRARYGAYVAARTEADRRGHPMPDGRTIHAAIRAYRAGWMPGHDARVRAQVAEEIAEDIEDNPGPNPSPAIPAWWSGWMEGRDEASAIARQHATTEHRCTDLADWHGGYRCSCGELWLIGADRCMTQPTPLTTEESDHAE